MPGNCHWPISFQSVRSRPLFRIATIPAKAKAGYLWHQ
jgi:hypothetical protein